MAKEWDKLTGNRSQQHVVEVKHRLEETVHLETYVGGVLSTSHHLPPSHT